MIPDFSELILEYSKLVWQCKRSSETKRIKYIDNDILIEVEAHEAPEITFRSLFDLEESITFQCLLGLRGEDAFDFDGFSDYIMERGRLSRKGEHEKKVTILNGVDYKTYRIKLPHIGNHVAFLGESSSDPNYRHDFIYISKNPLFHSVKDYRVEILRPHNDMYNYRLSFWNEGYFLNFMDMFSRASGQID